MVKGTNAKEVFQDLSVRVGIGMKRSNICNITKLFEWNIIESHELEFLNGNGKRQSQTDKEYRHLCYMFELAYALAIEPSKNISSNPGCEWQTQYYGK